MPGRGTTQWCAWEIVDICQAHPVRALICFQLTTTAQEDHKEAANPKAWARANGERPSSAGLGHAFV